MIQINDCGQRVISVYELRDELSTFTICRHVRCQPTSDGKCHVSATGPTPRFKHRLEFVNHIINLDLNKSDDLELLKILLSTVNVHFDGKRRLDKIGPVLPPNYHWRNKHVTLLRNYMIYLSRLEGKTYRSIAEVYGLSAGRARQIFNHVQRRVTRNTINESFMDEANHLYKDLRSFKKSDYFTLVNYLTCEDQTMYDDGRVNSF